MTISGAFLYICFFSSVQENLSTARFNSTFDSIEGLWRCRWTDPEEAELPFCNPGKNNADIGHNRGTMDARDVYSQPALKEIGWWFPDPWCHDLPQIVWNSGSRWPLWVLCLSCPLYLHPHSYRSLQRPDSSFRLLFSRYFVRSFFRYRKPNKKPILILCSGVNYEFYWTSVGKKCDVPFYSFYKHYLSNSVET